MSEAQIKKAAELLKNNEVVALPTETVYGLAARIDSEAAIKKIFSTKNNLRNKNNNVFIEINKIITTSNSLLVFRTKSN